MFLNMCQLFGFMCICLALIGMSVTEYDIITVQLCTDGKCNIDDVHCDEGHIFHIKRLIVWDDYVATCSNCSGCCGSTSNTTKLNVQYQYTTFWNSEVLTKIGFCDNEQMCVIQYGNRWTAKIEYVCIPITVPGSTTPISTTAVISKTTTPKTTVNGDTANTEHTTTATVVETINTDDQGITARRSSTPFSTAAIISKTTTPKTANGDTSNTIHTTSVNSTANVEDKINSEDSESGVFPTVVAVSVPIAIIAFVLIAITGYCVLRKRRLDKEHAKNVYSDASNKRNHSSMAISNKAYTDCCPDDDVTDSNKPTHQQLSVSRDSRYVEILTSTADQTNDEYNTIDFNSNSFPVDAGYGHLPKQKHNTNNTYAHITCGQLASCNDTTYSHVVSDNGLKKEPVIPSDENDHRYNTLHAGVVPRVVVEQEVDDEYNHMQFHRSAAKQGSTKRCADFGIKNETTYGKPVNVQLNLNNKRSCKDINDRKAEDEYAECESSDSPSNETNRTSDTDYQNVQYSRHHYFVLQKEDSQSEEVSDTGRHNYFVLEKNN